MYLYIFFLSGIQGILDAYTNCIQQIRLYGPTNVSPIIYHVARFAEAAQKEEATKGAHVRIDFIDKMLVEGCFITLINC